MLEEVHQNFMETHCSYERETWEGRGCSTLGGKVGIHAGLNITTVRGTGILQKAIIPISRF